MLYNQGPINWQGRLASRQVDAATLEQDEEEREAERNQQQGFRPRVRVPSKYRCDPRAHSGRTAGSDAKQRTFCLHFARGKCCEGPRCQFQHHLPELDDEQYFHRDMGHDIFGREKRAEAQGFHRGAGTFERDNRTLYVNYEGAGSYALPQIRQLLEENFAPWGTVTNIYIKHTLTIAFVTYEWRSSAEFAKEAMHRQRLIGSTQAEVLTVRWSNSDPNPTSVAKRKRDASDQFEQAVLESWDALPPDQKAARIASLQLAAALKAGSVVSDYPDTDHQFAHAGADGWQPSEQGRAAAVEGGRASHYPVEAFLHRGVDGAWANGGQQGYDDGTYDGGQGWAEGAQAETAEATTQGQADEAAGGSDGSNHGGPDAIALLQAYSSSGSEEGGDEGAGGDAEATFAAEGVPGRATAEPPGASGP